MIIGAREVNPAEATEFARWEEATMTDLPERPEDVQPFMDGLTFSEEPAELPPGPRSR